MPAKCTKCSVVFVTNEFSVKCVECAGIFHAACTSVGSAKNFTKTKLKSWRCDNCKGDAESVASSEDASHEDIKSVLEAISALKKDFKSELDKHLGEVKVTMRSATDELAKLNGKFDSLEQAQDKLCKRCDVLEHDRDKLQDEVCELRHQHQDAEQHARCANLEVLGLPLTPKENVYDCLEKIAQVLGIPFKREEISIAHRLRLFSKRHVHPPLVVQFVSRSTKESWMAAARRKKGFSTREVAATLTPGNIYLNEQLTPHNKALLGRARRLMKVGKIHHAGFYNGKVIIRPTENADTRRVRDLEDLDPFDA